MSRSIVYISNLWLSTVVWIQPTSSEMSEFNICHDDFNLNPPDGILKEYTFSWLGFVQHIHEVTGLLHGTRAPRVVLIHKQFCITMAKDVLKLPRYYKLGNVIFGDYEREGEDCGLSSEDILKGYKCPRAYMEMALGDILPHPEFSSFAVKNSLALVKLYRPIKSCYMVPICLPTLEERKKMKKISTVFLIDYISSVPNDFDFERMGKRTLKLLTPNECSRTLIHGFKASGSFTQILCSSGCGMRPGAPIITHTVDGRFELIGLAVGGRQCANDNMRKRFNENPPFYIDVYPYVPWIVNVITAHKLPKPYPQNFQLVQGGSHLGQRSTRKSIKSGWKGRTYLWGESCFVSTKNRQDLFFYRETFSVHGKLESPTELHITLKISSGIECQVSCVRLLLPHRLFNPIITSNNLDLILKLEAITFTEFFYFSLGVTGKNVSGANYLKRRDSLNDRLFM